MDLCLSLNLKKTLLDQFCFVVLKQTPKVLVVLELYINQADLKLTEMPPVSASQVSASEIKGMYHHVWH